MSKTLKIGDKVLWRGGFGSDPAKVATIESIEVTNGGKYGDQVDEVDWSKVKGRNVVVDLAEGNWAYGEQIRPYSGQ